MHKLLITSAIVLSLAGGSAALAAGKAKPMAPKPVSAAPADKAKTAACEKEWKAEKKHTQTRKAFMASCTTKA